MDLENFGGASTLLCIDFLKLWGGQWPPWPPRFRRPWTVLKSSSFNNSIAKICAKGEILSHKFSHYFEIGTNVYEMYMHIHT